MNEARLKGLMGLCVRAGQSIFGEDSCLKALRAGQAALLILDDGISEKSAEKLERVCEREKIPRVRLAKGLLEQATGRPGMAMSVRSGSFAEQMIRCLDEAGQQ